MRYVTHCPSCGTAYKIVDDQLRIAQGWVRCGHCGEPFNALDHLIDLTPAPAPAPAAEDADAARNRAIAERVASLDPDALSPREALEALYELKRLSSGQ